MIDVTFSFNDYDLHELLSTWSVVHEVETADSVTAIDGTEYFAVRRRPTINFTLIPLSDAQAQEVYDVLSGIIADAEYTDPYLGERIASMRVSTNLEAAFGLRSVDGNRYYKGGIITLRQRTVL